jgi:anaerobic ribonucleoside-triphosphate reductase activating protein
MNYAKIVDSDIVNGWGLRVSLWACGCRRHCEGCFNEGAWDFRAGKPFDVKAYYKIFKELNEDCVRGLTILGGEPFEPENAHILAGICEDVKKIYGNAKDIWIYSGYTLEELLEIAGRGDAHSVDVSKLLRLCDVLVDGEFVEELKDLELRFRGSSNQRIIDLRASRTNGFERVVEWES